GSPEDRILDGLAHRRVAIAAAEAYAGHRSARNLGNGNFTNHAGPRRSRLDPGTHDPGRQQRLVLARLGTAANRLALPLGGQLRRQLRFAPFELGLLALATLAFGLLARQALALRLFPFGLFLAPAFLLGLLAGGLFLGPALFGRALLGKPRLLT